jgi:hypothetical protein
MYYVSQDNSVAMKNTYMMEEVLAEPSRSLTYPLFGHFSVKILAQIPLYTWQESKNQDSRLLTTWCMKFQSFRFILRKLS